MPGFTLTYVTIPTQTVRCSTVAVYRTSKDAFPSQRGTYGDVDEVVETGRAVPLEDGLHQHHVEVPKERLLRVEPHRLEPSRARLVEVREPMGVEHHALGVDFGVAGADAVDEGHGVSLAARRDARGRQPRRTAGESLPPRRR